MATWFTWCILKSPGGLDAYREEIEKILILENGRPDHEVRFDIQLLKENQYVQGVWKEALRTGSASAAARVVAKDSEIEGFVVRPGSVVMIPVHLLHFDEKVFEDPHEIDPTRWIARPKDTRVEAERLKKQSSSLRSFGGGTGLCSGRFVAEQEIISVVSTILLLFDMEFVTPVADFKLNPQSIGIMSPTKDPVVRLKRRTIVSRE